MNTWRAGCGDESHVRFGGRARETDQQKRRNRARVRPYTYVELAGGGFCYAAFVTDAFSRAIVGWQVADTLRTELALDALEMALRTRQGKLSKALVHHGD